MPFYTPENFEPETSLGYLVRRANQIGQVTLEPMFASEGLTGVQWSALVCIHFGRGRTCAELARELNHDKGAMTRLIDIMEERGWVTRHRDNEDRRVINLELTDAGEEVAQRCRRRVIDYWNEWLADWSDEDIEQAIRVMRRLRDTIERASAANVPA